MYMIKNAIRNITRLKGKHLLLGCITFVIGLATCLSLSIQAAAQTEKENGLENLTITATIAYDRQAMMESMRSSSTSEQDPKTMMKNVQSLSLDEMAQYAQAEAVKAFYYTGSVSVNGSGIEAITTQSSDTSNAEMPQGKGMPGQGRFANMGDLSITGYSSHDAMQEFVDGVKTIKEGTLFEEGSVDASCLIHEEFAIYNDIAINDTIQVVNPQNEEEILSLKVIGVYTSDATTSESNFMQMTMMDPANQIYMSYDALQKLIATSSGDTAMTMQTTGTYTFQDVQAYEAFEEQAHALGLSDEYTVTSKDVMAYEQSLQPLKNLSTYATYFLFIFLIIGSCILIVLHMYHIRERKYEIGVLAAIGMQKQKIAFQFIAEIFFVTMTAIVIGCGVGAFASVPVTNALLSTQTGNETSMLPNESNAMDMQAPRKAFSSSTTEMISTVEQATDVNVILQIIGIGVLLTLLTGGTSVLAVLRYEPLKILSNRE